MSSVTRNRHVVQWSVGILACLALTIFGCCPQCDTCSMPPKPKSEPKKTAPAVKGDLPAVEAPVQEMAAPAEEPTEEPAEKSADPKPEAKTSALGAAGAGKVASEAAVPSNPTLTPAVAWMTKPTENPAAEAKDQAGMKPYTETVADTDVKFEMMPIPGGTFKMGSPDAEADRNDDEGPQIEVKLEPFWMGKHEVTWSEYEQWGLGLDLQRRKAKSTSETDWNKLADALAIPTKPYSDMTFGMGKEGYPAVCMTQFAAKMYCKWLSAKTGRYYRLPTEAEWEYACRAGTSTAYSFGDDPEKLDDYGWYEANSDEKYHKIGEKKPNAWGLYDMHGNVAEWCVDEYAADRYKQWSGKLIESPLAVVTKMYPQVVRGGAWTDEAPLLRSAARRGSSKDWKMQDPQIPQSIWYYTDANFVGFRVVRPLRTPTAEEAARYEVTPFEMEDYLDYKKAQAGKQ